MLSELINDLKAHRSGYIDSNPIFARLATGDITRFHYLAYLRETYHLIKHSPKYLTIAANRVAANDERLSDYFRNFSLQETGHELLCIRDINALGENADKILSGEQNSGVWGMVTQCYFWASLCPWLWWKFDSSVSEPGIFLSQLPYNERPQIQPRLEHPPSRCFQR